MAQRKRPSMSDVARLAGVSTQTVSRVINGEPYVKEAKRESVMEAMQQLHYVPNSAARAMKTGSFKNIGVVYHTLHPVGNRLALEGIVEAAAAQNYRTSLIHWSSLVSRSSQDESQTVMRLGEMSIDAAIVIVSSSSESGAATTRMGRLPVPTVVLGSVVAGDVSSVGIDQATGTEAAVTHLLDQGHATVHHIAGPALSIHSQSRQHAWQATLERNSRPTPRIARGDWSPTSGYLAAQELLRGEMPTAIFVANDQMALGAYRAILEACASPRTSPSSAATTLTKPASSQPHSPPLTSTGIVPDMRRCALHSTCSGQVPPPQFPSRPNLLFANRPHRRGRIASPPPYLRGDSGALLSRDTTIRLQPIGVHP